VRAFCSVGRAGRFLFTIRLKRSYWLSHTISVHNSSHYCSSRIMALLTGNGTFLTPNVDIDSNWICKCSRGDMGLTAVVIHKSELIYVFSNRERDDPFLDMHPLFNEFICWAPVAFMHRTNDGFSIMSKSEYNNLRLHEEDPIFSATTNALHNEMAASEASEYPISEMTSDDDEVVEPSERGEDEVECEISDI
jgi:hypothetical protein